MPSAPTPQSVADALAEVLPRRTNIFHVELCVATTGCRARAHIKLPGEHNREVTGLGETLPEAIVALHSEATRYHQGRRDPTDPRRRTRDGAAHGPRQGPRPDGDRIARARGCLPRSSEDDRTRRRHQVHGAEVMSTQDCDCSPTECAPEIAEDEDGDPVGRHCVTCGGHLPDVGPKESAYDEHMSPLVAQLIALSKEHGVTLFVHCVLDGAPDSVTTSVHEPEDKDLCRDLLRVARPAPATWSAYMVVGGPS